MSAALFSGFGLLWIVTGFVQIRHATPGVCLFLVLGSVSLTVASVWFQRPEGRLSTQGAGLKDERLKRMLFAVTIVQAVSIVTAASILALLRRPDYTGVAIILLVGVHLLPMAVFGHFYADMLTTGLLLAWSLGCTVLLSRSHVAVPAQLGAGCIMLAGTMLRKLGRPTADVAPGTWRES